MTIDNNRERGAMPLENEKKEKFCKYYANDCWGNPALAVQMAGFCCTATDAALLAEDLFDDEGVRKRIRFLRGNRMKKSLADTLWIRETLTAIALNATRDSDRIRALNVLAKIIDPQGDKRRNTDPQDRKLSGEQLIEQLLPLFEGDPDGCEYDEESEKSLSGHLPIP